MDARTAVHLAALGLFFLAAAVPPNSACLYVPAPPDLDAVQAALDTKQSTDFEDRLQAALVLTEQLEYARFLLAWGRLSAHQLAMLVADVHR
ncbi:MAG: hypothetical protein JSV80_12100 [Acidobacteriota bacterium]|nr:MAG: hypothetical protein JSV80_12100 [Acidobacteriota bacterium]